MKIGEQRFGHCCGDVDAEWDRDAAALNLFLHFLGCRAKHQGALAGDEEPAKDFIGQVQYRQGCRLVGG